MGRGSRFMPKRLAEKLLYVRQSLGLSQNELLRAFGNPEKIIQASVSCYERGEREPPLDILLQYARIAGVCIDLLINDDLELPKRLPAKPKHRK